MKIKLKRHDQEHIMGKDENDKVIVVEKNDIYEELTPSQFFGNLRTADAIQNELRAGGKNYVLDSMEFVSGKPAEEKKPAKKKKEVDASENNTGGDE